jgi:hypothetical protein
VRELDLVDRGAVIALHDARRMTARSRGRADAELRCGLPVETAAHHRRCYGRAMRNAIYAMAGVDRQLSTRSCARGGIHDRARRTRVLRHASSIAAELTSQ